MPDCGTISPGLYSWPGLSSASNWKRHATGPRSGRDFCATADRYRGSLAAVPAFRALAIPYRTDINAPALDRTRRNGMARRIPPRKVRYFEPVAPRLARNTVIESTFEVGRRFRCTMRVDCGQLDPGAVIRPEPGEWHPRMPERLDEDELADWRAGRDAVYQLAALTVGGRLAIADG